MKSIKLYKKSLCASKPSSWNELENRCFLYHLQMWTLHLLQECLHWCIYLWCGFILFFSSSFQDWTLFSSRRAHLLTRLCHDIIASANKAHRCKREIMGVFVLSKSNNVIILFKCTFAQLCPTLVPRWENLTCAPNAFCLCNHMMSEHLWGDDRASLQVICQIRHIAWRYRLVINNSVPKISSTNGDIWRNH